MNTLIPHKILDSTQFTTHSQNATVHHFSSSSEIGNHCLWESVSQRPLLCWHTLHARWIVSNTGRCGCWRIPSAAAAFCWFTGGCKCFYRNHESWHTYTSNDGTRIYRGIAHVCLSYCTHIRESQHMYPWVIAQIFMSATKIHACKHIKTQTYCSVKQDVSRPLAVR